MFDSLSFGKKMTMTFHFGLVVFGDNGESRALEIRQSVSHTDLDILLAWLT